VVAVSYDSGLATLEGRFDDAERLVDESFRIGRRIEHPYARGVQRVHSALLARARGDEARVLEIFDPTPPIRGGPTQWVQAFAARAAAAVGRVDEARRLLDDLADGGFEAIPRNIRWHGTILEVAHLCADLGDAERAAALRPLLLPVAQEHGVLPLAICYGGPVSRCLARFAEMLGESDEALHRFEQALDACRELGARPMHAQVLVEQGTLMMRRGERSRGRERVAEGVAAAESLGMRGVVAAGRAVLERSDATRR